MDMRYDAHMNALARAMPPINLLNLEMLRRVLDSIRLMRPDYCRTEGDDNIAALLLKLFQHGIHREDQLRHMFDVGERVPGSRLYASPTDRTERL